MKESIKILLYINRLILVIIGMFFPIYIVLLSNLGINYLARIGVFCVFLLTAAIISILIKKYETVLKESEMPIIIGLFVLGIGILGFLFTSSLILFIIIQILTGIGLGIYIPAYLILFRLHAKKQKLNKVQLFLFDILLILFGALIGSLITDLWGLNFLYIVMTGLSFFGAIFTLTLPRKML